MLFERAIFQVINVEIGYDGNGFRLSGRNSTRHDGDIFFRSALLGSRNH